MVLTIMMSNASRRLHRNRSAQRRSTAVRCPALVRRSGRRGGRANPAYRRGDTHLHYGAQADLVQVLEEQDEAAKVIYTTHSAGCLPRDLGTRIRATVPTYREEDGETVQTDDSEVINKFWTKGRGLSPILIAMGASALAFAATRRAIAERGSGPNLLRASGTSLICAGPPEVRVAVQRMRSSFSAPPTMLTEAVPTLVQPSRRRSSRSSLRNMVSQGPIRCSVAR
jgi:hypothetical protein